MATTFFTKQNNPFSSVLPRHSGRMINSLRLLAALFVFFSMSAFSIVDPAQTQTRLADNNGSNNSAALQSFVAKVENGDGKAVVGVYVENLFALPVVQQPDKDPGFVSPIFGQVTQIKQATTYAGNTGFVAHNYLSGAYFFKMQMGDVVQVVYGDGSIHQYKVSKIQSFQALTPTSTTSNFKDLTDGKILSAQSLFYQVFGGDKHVTFEVCIAKGSEGSWGRMFVSAVEI